MTSRFVIEPAAELDLADALAWYDEHAPGIGSAFLDAVTETFESIERAPEQYHPERGDVRKALVPHFPYIVYFVVLPELLSGIAVFHTSRDPTIWHHRAVG
jgi:toxin ParE1/3/4